MLSRLALVAVLLVPCAQARPSGCSVDAPALDADLARACAVVLAAVPGWWERLSPTLAQFLTQFLFPAPEVRPEVEQQVSALLDQDLPAGCRRVLLEQRDDLQRALRAQSSR